MVKKKQYNSIKFTFLIAMIVLISLSAISYIRLQNLIYGSEKVNNTQQINLELNKVILILTDVESGQRGFMLTKDSAFLSPVFAGKAVLNSHLDNIASLLQDNPAQLANLSILRTLVFKRLYFLQQIIDDAEFSTIDKQRWLTGKSLMDDVTKQINKMESEENKLLENYTVTFNKSTFVAPLLTIILIIGSIVILSVSYFKIMKKARVSDKLQSEIENSEEQYHRMIAEVKDYAILFLNQDGIIQNWNDGAKKIKGYSAEEIVGNNFRIFYTEQDKRNHLPEKLLAEAKQNNTALDEGWRVRKDGSLFWGSIVITAIHDKTNNLIGFSKVTRDLTSKKIAEDKIKAVNHELKLKNEELIKSNKELESFTYISSHDLQEPLRQIQILTSRINGMERDQLSDKGKFYLEKMNNAASRMQTLIIDLLAYSRTKTGTRKYKLTNLKNIVNEIKEDFADTIGEKYATIEVEDLYNINVIHFQFRQAIHNLISNSLKFSKPDIPVHIYIKNNIVKASEVKDINLAAGTDYYHVSITDNGIGFESKYRERIFEVFQRLVDKQKIAGTGIGLAIVKKIVENHNGIISASSELNEGATFNIYIPKIQKT